MPNTRNDTATASVKPIICTWLYQVLYVLKRQKEVFLGAEGRAKQFKRVVLR